MDEDRHGVEYTQGDVAGSLRRAKRGVIWARSGRLMGIAALAVVGWAQSETDLTGSLLKLAGVALMLAGLSSYIRGKRLQSVPAETRMVLDQRPPVLYLRSFKDDKAAEVVPLAGSLGYAAVFFGLTTEKEQLAEAMNEIGPLS